MQCPSCTARRAAETAAHLVDAVLPHVPMRQYVISMAPDLHHRLARDGDLETKTLAIFLDELTTHLRVTSGAVGEPGFVTFIQHFSSSLGLHVHFHVLSLDGVYVREGDSSPEFLRAREPTQAQIEALVAAAAKRIREATGRTDPQAVPVVEAPVLRLVEAEPAEPSAGHRKLTAESDGFNLHAATSFEAHERCAIERFCRYAARGPLALSRLSLAPNGNVVYRLKTPRPDGTSQVVFTPRSLLVRLSWLIALPGIHLTRYHAVLGPNHAWRSEVVPERHVRLPGQPRCKRARLDWNSLLRRIFAIDALLCAVCGGRRRIIAEIKEGPVARKILAHLGLPTFAPKPAQGGLFATGPPEVDESEATVAWCDADYDQRLPDSDLFV